MTVKIYQYISKHPNDLVRLLDGLPNASVVDIRVNTVSGPTSEAWSNERLKYILGHRYTHAPQFKDVDLQDLRRQAQDGTLILIAPRRKVHSTVWRSQIQNLIGADVELYEEENTTPSTGNTLLTMDEAAAYLGITRNTVYYHVYQSGHLKGEHYGRSRLFSTHELDEFRGLQATF